MKTALTAAPVGSGPYKFKSLGIAATTIKLEANADYHGGAPEIESVTYRFIEESGTRMSALMAGEVDIITNLLPEFKQQVPQAASKRGLEHPVILLNTYNGITQDKRVRQALNYAVDKEALAARRFSKATPRSRPVNFWVQDLLRLQRGHLGLSLRP